MIGGLLLNDVNILDFTWWAAGPFTTQYLANFGATVIKVESPKRPDLFRVSEPYKEGAKPGPDRSGLFLQANTSKYSIVLDVTHPRGLDIAYQLVAWADVVCDNFSPGVMDKLGLGYDDLKKLNPDIIAVSCSIGGRKGVWPPLRGQAVVATALSGQYDLSGYADGEPMVPSVGVADVTQAIVAVVAILGALDYKRRTGKGQFIDISQVDVMSYFISQAILDYEVNRQIQTRVGNCHPHAAPHGAFRCKGADRWCVIAVFNEQEWRSLCHAMGDPLWAEHAHFSTLSSRKDNEDELEKLITTWTINLDADDVVAQLQGVGIAAGVVRKGNELTENAHLKERGLFMPLEHPVLGICNHPVPAVKLSRCSPSVRTAPCLGEHTAYVCTSILGMSDKEFSELMGAGVFGDV